MLTKKILAFGEILWDLLPDGKQLGGAPGNFTYHSRVIGNDAIMISRVGNDELGREIALEFANRSIDTDFIGIDFERPTGTVEVDLDRLGHPVYQIVEDVAWDRINPSKPALNFAEEVDAIYFGSLAMRYPQNRASFGKLLASVSKSALKVFDLNLRAPYYSSEIIRNLLSLCDVFKLNDEELLILAPFFETFLTPTPFFNADSEGKTILAEDKKAFIDRLFTLYPLKYIILTCGDKGSFIFDAAGNFSYAPSVSLEVLDTVGAGDAFTAVAVYGLLRGEPLEKINHQASQYAAYICSQSGGMPSVDSQRLKDWGFDV